MSGGEVSDQTGSVHGNIATLGTGKGGVFSQKRRNFVFEVDREVVRLVLGGEEREADLTLVSSWLDSGHLLGNGAHTGSFLQQLHDGPVSQTVVDEYLPLSVSGDVTQPALVWRSGLHLELRGQLVIEVLSGVVLVQVKLPPEGLGAQGTGVEHLSPRDTQRCLQI